MLLASLIGVRYQLPLKARPRLGCSPSLSLAPNYTVTYPLLYTLSRLHKSRRDSNRCSFFAEAECGFCIPRAQQERKTVGAAARITRSLPRIASARSNLLPGTPSKPWWLAPARRWP